MLNLQLQLRSLDPRRRKAPSPRERPSFRMLPWQTGMPPRTPSSISTGERLGTTYRSSLCRTEVGTLAPWLPLTRTWPEPRKRFLEQSQDRPTQEQRGNPLAAGIWLPATVVRTLDQALQGGTRPNPCQMTCTAHGVLRRHRAPRLTGFRTHPPPPRPQRVCRRVRPIRAAGHHSFSASARDLIFTPRPAVRRSTGWCPASASRYGRWPRPPGYLLRPAWR